MIDGWSWFRERADVELGDMPPEPGDRLGAIVASAAAPGRRRISEIGVAAGVAVVALAVVGATVVLSRPSPAANGPSLPAPTEVTSPTGGSAPAPAPGEIGNDGTTGPASTGTVGGPRRSPGTTGTPTGVAPTTSRASATGTPSAPASTTPRRTTPAPVTTTPTPPPTTTNPPTTTPPTTTSPAPVVP